MFGILLRRRFYWNFDPLVCVGLQFLRKCRFWKASNCWAMFWRKTSLSSLLLLNTRAPLSWFWNCICASAGVSWVLADFDVCRISPKVPFKRADRTHFETLRLFCVWTRCTVTSFLYRTSGLRLSRLVSSIRLLTNTKRNMFAGSACLEAAELAFESLQFVL